MVASNTSNGNGFDTTSVKLEIFVFGSCSINLLRKLKLHWFVGTTRKAYFDIYCESVKGEKFIVEMQKAKAEFFKDRALFYTSFPIREQAQKGEWTFELLPVYFIAVLDFEYDKGEKVRKFKRDVFLKDQDGDIFYRKLQFIFLQMPFFNKQEDELETHFDKWCYFLKHLKDFDHIPAILNEPFFQKGFEIAEISHLTPAQHELYQKSLLQYWEVKNVSDTSFKDGKIEGELEKAKEIAKNLLAMNLSVDDIVKATGLNPVEIENLKNEEK